MDERSRQYETTSKVEEIQKKLHFMKGDNKAACGKYLNASYVPKPNDVTVLSQHISKLNEMKNNVTQLKADVLAFDQSLFDKSGRKLNSGKTVQHSYNTSTAEKLNSIEQEISAFITQISEKANELSNTFKGILTKKHTSKCRKRKENNRKAQKRKQARLENTTVVILQKIAPGVMTESSGVENKIEKDALNIEELQNLSKREVKVMQSIMQSDKYFSDEAKKYISSELSTQSVVTTDDSDCADSDSAELSTQSVFVTTDDSDCAERDNA